MVEINWGKGPYGTYKPGHSEPDRTTIIPESGELKPLPEYIIEKMLPFEEAKIHGYCSKDGESPFRKGSGEFHVPLKLGSCDHIREIQIRWAEERGEWIAINYNLWLENGADDDESHGGPYALENYCKRKILEAYQIPLGELTLEEVGGKSPSELEKQADSAR